MSNQHVGINVRNKPFLTCVKFHIEFWCVFSKDSMSLLAGAASTSPADSQQRHVLSFDKIGKNCIVFFVFSINISEECSFFSFPKARVGAIFIFTVRLGVFYISKYCCSGIA